MSCEIYFYYNWQIGYFDSPLFANRFQLRFKLDKKIHVVLIAVAKMWYQISLGHGSGHGLFNTLDRLSFILLNDLNRPWWQWLHLFDMWWQVM